MKQKLNNSKIRCILVRPHRLPEILRINNSLSSFEKGVGGTVDRILVPELGDQICLLIRKEGFIFTPEKNRPLFDDKGNPYDCIYGSFFIVGMEGGAFRSLDDRELVRALRLYEQPYKIIIDDNNNHFIACIPEEPSEMEAVQC